MTWIGYLWRMKNWTRVAAMLFLLLIYCCGIGVAGRTLHTPPVEQFSEGTHISAAKTTMFHHIQQNETNYFQPNELPGSAPNLIDGGPSGALRALNQLFLAKDRQYAKGSVNLLIRHRKANLIFPFHSFW